MADEAPIPDPAPAGAAPEPAAPAPEPAEAAPAVEAPAEPVAPAAEPSLLESFKAEGEEKPAEGERPAESGEKPVDEPKPAEGEKKPEGEAKPAEPAAPEPIVYEAFTLPEGVTIEQERLAPVTEILAGHRVPQEAAQKLIDAHTTAMKDYADHLTREQHRVFNETRKSWQTEVKADEEIGGSGFNTSLAAAGQARDRFIKPNELTAFDDMCRMTGVGDHPVFLKMMSRIGRAFKEPASPPPNPNPSPTPTVQDRRATMYPTMVPKGS